MVLINQKYYCELLDDIVYHSIFYHPHQVGLGRGYSVSVGLNRWFPIVSNMKPPINKKNVEKD